MNPDFLSCQAPEASYRLRCYSLSTQGGYIKQAIYAGPSSTCQGAFALLNGNGQFLLQGQPRNWLLPCKFHYQRLLVRALEKNFFLLIVRSKDPACIWSATDDELYHTLSSPPYETPLLPAWMPLLRRALTGRRLLTSLEGHNPQGSYLNITPAELDTLVAKGVREKKLLLSE